MKKTLSFIALICVSMSALAQINNSSKREKQEIGSWQAGQMKLYRWIEISMDKNDTVYVLHLSTQRATSIFDLNHEVSSLDVTLGSQSQAEEILISILDHNWSKGEVQSLNNPSNNKIKATRRIMGNWLFQFHSEHGYLAEVANEHYIEKALNALGVYRADSKEAKRAGKNRR